MFNSKMIDFQYLLVDVQENNKSMQLIDIGISEIKRSLYDL